jgi:hypothetical protein
MTPHKRIAAATQVPAHVAGSAVGRAVTGARVTTAGVAR